MVKKLKNNQEKWNKHMKEIYQKEMDKKKQEKEKEKEKQREKQRLARIEGNKDPKKDLVEEYKKLQKEFIKTDDDETIKKWKILSKAYKIGKEIYGGDFSIVKLSQHFDTPYTTVKRVLSLDRANERTWSLIKKGEISAFKVAQICMNKSIKYQDQIVDLVIAENLSTYQIKDLRIKENGLDVNTVRLEKAVQQGFTRKATAYKSYADTIKRMIRLLDIKKKDLPEKHISDIIGMLDELQNKINKKIVELVGG